MAYHWHFVGQKHLQDLAAPGGSESSIGVKFYILSIPKMSCRVSFVRHSLNRMNFFYDFVKILYKPAIKGFACLFSNNVIKIYRDKLLMFTISTLFIFSYFINITWTYSSWDLLYIYWKTCYRTLAFNIQLHADSWSFLMYLKQK